MATREARCGGGPNPAPTWYFRRMDSNPGSPPATAEILAAAGQRMLKADRVELARTLAELALAEDEGCVAAHNVLSVVHERSGAWQQGLEHASRVCELEPQVPKWRYNLALATLRLDDYRTGFGCWRRGSTGPTGRCSRSPAAGRPSVTGCCSRARRPRAGVSWWSPNRVSAIA